MVVYTKFDSHPNTGTFKTNYCDPLSVSSNIAEGYERIHIKEVVYFLNVAKGSSGEARSQVLIAGRFGIIEQAFANELVSEYSEISKMLYGLIQAKLKQGKG